jgi:exonuclease SbcC
MDLIKELHVQNFQSIAKQQIALGLRESGGGLTLVVGPSSTGKSAMLRAMRLLAYNSTSVPVRAGEKKTNIDIVFDSGKTVGVERGKSLSTYTIDKDVYQKSGTSVPKDVSKTLNFYGESHFAFQFDSPFLLAEPGSTITRIFGEITNAHVLTEAVREGDRLKKAQASLAKTRHADAVEALERLKTFEGLETRKKTVEGLERLVQALEGYESEVSRLESLLARHNRANTALNSLSIREPQDISEYIIKTKKILELSDRLSTVLSTLHDKKTAYLQALDEAKEAKKDIKNLEQARHDLLHEMGVCPLCGKAQ